MRTPRSVLLLGLALAALIPTAGAASADTTRPGVAPAAPAPAAPSRAATPPPLQLSARRDPNGNVVVTVTNPTAWAVAANTRRLDLSCTSPNGVAAYADTTPVGAIAARGSADVTVLDVGLKPPLPGGDPGIGPLIGSKPAPPKPAKPGDGPAWTCAISLPPVVQPGSARTVGLAEATASVSWGPEADLGISNIAFESAGSAPPSTNVRVSIVTKKPLFGSSIPRSVQLACQKAGMTPRTAQAAAADSVLFGALGAGFLPAPATGWACRATLVGPGPDKDPSNDSWALTAP